MFVMRSGKLLNDVDTGSQVSGIVWNEEYTKFQLTKDEEVEEVL